MANWTADIESTVFSLIKSKTYSDLTGAYPNINYTTEQSTVTTTKFPTVYIHLLPMVEYTDLEGTSINGVLATFQINVTTNTSKADAHKIIYTILDAFKELHFAVTSMPEYSKDDDIYQEVMRVRRTIGGGDTLL